MAAALRKKGTAGELPAAGAIYSFRTRLSAEAPQYAAFKVIGANDDLVAISLLDGNWPVPPHLEAAKSADILRRTFHSIRHVLHPLSGNRLEVFGIWADWWMPAALDEMAYVGMAGLSVEEAELADGILRYLPFALASYAPLAHIAGTVEREWRWNHDREAFRADHERAFAELVAENAAKEERYRTRLKGLTWDKLLAEPTFERWSESPPFPPREFAEAARQTIRQACGELRDLGPKPRKAQVRAILRRCVEWFNEADKGAGLVIETEEREDICAILEEMAFVAKQKSLVDEIGAWREW